MIGRTVSHYRILEKLGEGGMGVVYKAEDTKLHRHVALKFLPREALASGEAKARLLHEAQAAAALDHQNICTIHEIAEADGHTFIVMAYVVGMSLKEKIDAGPLKLEEALDLVIQTAKGLQEAHGKDIVHRDIKPANVMVSASGQVKIMDFGLARSAGQTRLTKAGTTLGTAAYMSPEQARGEAIDRRTDIWSLGAMLYEMIAGRPPFQGENQQAVLYAVLNEKPEPLTGLRTGVPVELERIADKCLAKRPQERYQHVDDMLVDLETIGREAAGGAKPASVARTLQPTSTARAVADSDHRSRRRRTALQLGSAILAVVLVAVALIVLTGRDDGTRPADSPDAQGSPAIQSLAVLPFDNLMNDPEQDYFVDGMHEALITTLSRIGKMRVISRTSVLRYRDGEKPVPEIARELDVDAVIEGSVLRVGDDVRITAQLIDGSTDEHLWADSYDRDLVHVLALLDEVARAIAVEVRATLTAPADTISATSRKVNPDAYEAWLRGQRLLEEFESRGAEQAISYFEQALRIDPEFAASHAGLAAAHFILMIMGRAGPKETAPLVRSHAVQALELDPDQDGALAMLGYTDMYFDWDWESAAARFRRALQINPNNFVAYHGLADCEAARGNHDESIRLVRRGWQCNPFSRLATAPVIGHLLMARRYEEMITEGRRMMAADPELKIVHIWIARALWQLGRYEEALAEYRLRGSAYCDTLATVLEGGLRESGPEGAMLAVARMLEDFARVRSVDPSDIARYYAMAGEKDLAFAWIDRALEKQDPFLIHSVLDPRLDSLREDARFKAVRRRMGLGE